MENQANHKRPGNRYNVHSCQRHADLTILLKSANKHICNTCFATLKKSYFNVIAATLLELHWLHNMTQGLVQQDTALLKRLQAQEEAILNLQAEITDIKNNGRNHEPQNTKPTHHTIPETHNQDNNRPPSDPKIICSEGHVAKVAHSLQDLLHVKIARVLKSWKKKKDTTCP